MNKAQMNDLVNAWESACKNVEVEELDVKTEVQAGGVTWPPENW